MFYSDESMHKKFEENEEFKYNLEYRFPILFAANVIYKIIIILFYWLINVIQKNIYNIFINKLQLKLLIIKNYTDNYNLI